MDVESIQIIESRIFQIILIGVIVLIICRYIYLMFNRYLDRRITSQKELLELLKTKTDTTELVEIKETLNKLSSTLEKLVDKLPLLLIVFLFLSCEPDRITIFRMKQEIDKTQNGHKLADETKEKDCVPKCKDNEYCNKRTGRCEAITIEKETKPVSENTLMDSVCKELMKKAQAAEVYEINYKGHDYKY